MARPTAYDEQKHQAAIDYIEGGWEAAGDAIPSAVGMAIEIGVNRDTLYQWAEDERECDNLGKFSDTLKQCQDRQHRVSLNGGIKGDFNPTITKLVLANHGYSEKAQVDTNVKVSQADDTEW